MDIKVGDVVMVVKPDISKSRINDGLYWHDAMDSYDGYVGRVSEIDDDEFSFRLEDDPWDWCFRPSWVVKVANETLVSSMNVDELFG